MSYLAMELRAADVSQREIVGVVAPYNEVTDLVSTPGGEVLLPGAFTRSLGIQRVRGVPLFRNHDHGEIYGWSVDWADTATESTGTFKVRAGELGDKLLADAHDGYLPGMSIDFQPVKPKRRSDGVVAIDQAKLLGVSLVTIPAYAGAGVLATRAADSPTPFDVAALFGPAPVVDLSPLPRLWR